MNWLAVAWSCFGGMTAIAIVLAVVIYMVYQAMQFEVEVQEHRAEQHRRSAQRHREHTEDLQRQLEASENGWSDAVHREWQLRTSLAECHKQIAIEEKKNHG